MGLFFRTIAQIRVEINYDRNATHASRLGSFILQLKLKQRLSDLKQQLTMMPNSADRMDHKTRTLIVNWPHSYAANSAVRWMKLHPMKISWTSDLKKTCPAKTYTDRLRNNLRSSTLLQTFFQHKTIIESKKHVFG